MEGYDDYTHNREYEETLLKQNEVANENIKASERMILSYKNMISKFEEVDDISKTGETIRQLNDELVRLSETTKVLTKTVSDNANVLNHRPTVDSKDFKTLSQEEINSLSKKNRKLYREKREEIDSENEEFKSRAERSKTDTESHLKDSGYVLATTKVRMRKFQDEYNSLKGVDEPKQENTTTDDETKGKKPDNSEDKKEESKLKKVGMFFAKSVGTVMLFSLKTAFAPLNFFMKGIGGILSGIWNSMLMGIAKTVALIGALVMGFDWIKITLASWKHEMTADFKKFTDKNGSWAKAITKIVEFGEAVKQFLDPDYQSDIIDRSVDSWQDVAFKFGEMLVEVLKEGMIELWDGIAFGLNNALSAIPGFGALKHTEESWKEAKAKSRDFITDDKVDAFNHKTARTQRELLAREGVMDGVNRYNTIENYYKTFGLNAEESLDEIAMEGALQKPLAKIYQAEKGVEYSEALHIIQNNPEIAREYLDRVLNVKRDMQSVGKDLDFNSTLNKFFGRVGSDGLTHLRNEDSEKLINDILPYIDSNVDIPTFDDIESPYEKKYNEFKKVIDDPIKESPIPTTVGKAVDMEGKNKIHLLSESENLGTTNSILMKILERLGIDRENGDSAVLTQVNNISNSYSTQTPSGYVPVSGYGTLRYGGNS